METGANLAPAVARKACPSLRHRPNAEMEAESDPLRPAQTSAAASQAVRGLCHQAVADMANLAAVVREVCPSLRERTDAEMEAE